ncbi:MAG: hypothetical protein LBL82_00310 [Oscillospiraceae bacterium]|jgi:hypothetical protein|nr:hypothetical protein [Oscillospiraceae bacterium]
MKLRELLKTFNGHPQNVDLYHDDYDAEGADDYDAEGATIAECCLNNFTEDGLSQFSEVLNANIVHISANGQDWISIFVTGVPLSAVLALSNSHAGNCSEECYTKWFNVGGDK